MKHLLIILISILLLSSFLTSCKKKETLYKWQTSSGSEWKTIRGKNNNLQYKGEVKREYIIFGDYIFDGLGSLTHPDGRKYVGEWKDGRKNGQGTETETWSVDGDKYEGEFKDGKRHGQGTYTSSYVGKYEGEYKEGEFHGQGKRTYLNGEKYEGEWKNGKRWEGKQLNKNGKITEIYFLGRKGKYYEPSSVNNSPLPDWLFYFMTSSFLPPELYVEDLRPFLSILSYNLTNWVRKFDFKKKDNWNRHTWLDFTFFQWCFTILFLLPIIFILRIIFIEKFKVLKSNKDKEGS